MLVYIWINEINERKNIKSELSSLKTKKFTSFNWGFKSKNFSSHVNTKIVCCLRHSISKKW